MALIVSQVGCASTLTTYNAKNLMADIVAKEQTTNIALEQTDIDTVTDFSFRLFGQMVSEKKNVMVSPTSVLTAMSMTGLGAKGETKKQMEQVLYGGKDIEKASNALGGWLRNLRKRTKAKFMFANSIWMKDGVVTPAKTFLQQNADYFQPEVYSAPFDSSTVTAINGWVEDKTDGMIPKIINKLKEDETMHLINAVAFQDEWKEPYEEAQMEQGKFALASGATADVTYLYSEEQAYLKDEQAVGVSKPYANGFSFVALLPKEGVSLSDYVKTLDGKKFQNLLQTAQETAVDTRIPKFKSEYSTSLKQVLLKMGIEDAFDGERADFTGIQQKEGANLLINDVSHKTYIEVDENGTKAAAVANVGMTETACALPQEKPKVELTRPFVYAIVDDSTGIPVFLGAVTNL